MAAGKRENTREYLERAIGSGFQLNSRGYSSNGIIKRTTVVGKGDVYTCGEKINRLATSGQFKTDVGVLADHQVTSATGQYDNVTMVFEELLSKNKDGFAIFTNMKQGTINLPLKYNTSTLTGSNYEQTKNAYKWRWDHSIYTRVDNAKTVSQTEWDAWASAGWNGLSYDDIKTGLNATDLQNKDILIVANGRSAPTGYTLALYAAGVVIDGSVSVGGKAVQSRLPETKNYYFPDITIVQTVYCENDTTVGNILSTTGTLLAPRKTNRNVYDTYGIDSTNKAWLCQVQGFESQSSITKATVSFKYRKEYWDTDVYPEWKGTVDPWVGV